MASEDGGVAKRQTSEDSDVGDISTETHGPVMEVLQHGGSLRALKPTRCR
jgi:hypothetical protein